jgi:hypothetical protein
LKKGRHIVISVPIFFSSSLPSRTKYRRRFLSTGSAGPLTEFQSVGQILYPMAVANTAGANTVTGNISKGALMPVASGRLIFYLNRVVFNVGRQPSLLWKGLHSGFRKDNYEGYR